MYFYHLNLVHPCLTECFISQHRGIIAWWNMVHIPHIWHWKGCFDISTAQKKTRDFETPTDLIFAVTQWGYFSVWEVNESHTAALFSRSQVPSVLWLLTERRSDTSIKHVWFHKSVQSEGHVRVACADLQPQLVHSDATQASRRRGGGIKQTKRSSKLSNTKPLKIKRRQLWHQLYAGPVQFALFPLTCPCHQKGSHWGPYWGHLCSHGPLSLPRPLKSCTAQPWCLPCTLHAKLSLTMPLDNRGPCLCYICSSLPWAMTRLYGWSLLFYISLPPSLSPSVSLHSDCIWRFHLWSDDFTNLLPLEPAWHLSCFHAFGGFTRRLRRNRAKNVLWSWTHVSVQVCGTILQHYERNSSHVDGTF